MTVVAAKDSTAVTSASSAHAWQNCVPTMALAQLLMEWHSALVILDTAVTSASIAHA